MNTPILRRTAAGAHLPWALILLVLGLLLAAAAPALAHGVTLGDKGYIQEVTGVKLIPFLYLGAKHMVTGYDHLLFLFGVIFFLYGMKQIGTYVTLFAIG
ncbi:MAG: HupE/UreJ family protein, partial [Paracoccaceae bacterium]|nr:HupE/UreJ family protein [Paracoccaceae bacterium]